MGTDWVWNDAISDWEWQWKDASGRIFDQEFPRSIKPPPIIGRPTNGKYGQHYVPEATYKYRTNVTDDAKLLLREGKGSFTEWPDGYPTHGWSSEHVEYNKAVNEELDMWIEANIPAGGKLGVTEAREFLKHIREFPAGTVIGDFNRSVRAEMAAIEERLEAQRLEQAALEEGKIAGEVERLKIGRGLGTTDKALIGLAVLGAAEAIDKRVKAGETVISAAGTVTKDIGMSIVTQPIHDVRKIAGTTQAAARTLDEVNNAAKTAEGLDRQAEAQAFNRLSVDPANAPIGFPRSPNSFGLATDLINGSGQAGAKSGTGFVKDLFHPVEYWWNRFTGN